MVRRYAWKGIRIWQWCKELWLAVPDFKALLKNGFQVACLPNLI